MTGDNSEGTEDFAELYLSSLPSMQFYNDVKKNHSDLLNYSHKCENLTIKKDNEEMKTVCKHFVRHLEKSTVWDVPNPQYDFCLLLNYWIYDRLTHIFVDKETSKLVFSNFQYIWNYPEDFVKKRISYKQKCKHNFDIYEHEDWEKRKEFYDYCIDYDTLKGLVNFSNDKCKDFYEYIKKKEELYKNFQHICSTESTECPIFYKECEKNDPKLLLSKLHCRQEMDQKKAAAHGSPLQPEPASGLRSLDSELLGNESGSPKTETTSHTPQIGRTVGHSVLGVAPVLLTATALYRYTPVGSWIRKLGATNTNGVGDVDGFSSYTQESGDMFLGSTENYISYQPM
ncbi:PIR protein [Plasmodium ovale]|uniref:PIR Superfamily Protein n=2 Tax=Plasmodium ovale TaxID=36330 RepID=A0A1A8XAQ5_PLAOA|nr:PIR Superfamily Protein [Plasmodium ovale curtisi]SBT85026.1 PIR protein [Plasmodium ovale]